MVKETCISSVVIGDWADDDREAEDEKEDVDEGDTGFG